MAIEMNGVEIKKVWLDEHLWIGPTDRMIKFGGPFLPDDIHATFLFETRSGELDLHLTRNFPGGVRRHVAVLRAMPADMRMITERWTARLARQLLPQLRRVRLGWLGRQGYLVAPLPERDGDPDPAEEERLRRATAPLIERQTGQGRGRYRVNLEDDRVESFIGRWSFGSDDEVGWLEENLMYPGDLRRLGSCAALVVGREGDGLVLYRFEVAPENFKHFVATLADIEEAMQGLVDGIATGRVGQAIKAKWERGVTILSGLDANDEHEPGFPLWLRPGGNGDGATRLAAEDGEGNGLTRSPR